MKTRNFQGLTVRIDRPKGFVQEGHDSDGKPWKRVYKTDYGFLPKTDGGDGDGLDVFLGPKEDASVSYWVFQKKDDGSFDEFKVFFGFSSPKEAKKMYQEHIPSKLFGGMSAIPMSMVKGLLGKQPLEKLAMKLSCIDELQTILLAG